MVRILLTKSTVVCGTSLIGTLTYSVELLDNLEY